MSESKRLDDSEQRQEARKRQAAERLGTTHPRCTTCGENDPRCLERHHIAGRKFGEDVVWACKNCHSRLSEAQNDHPQPIKGEPNWLEQIGRFLLGLADLLLLAAKKLKDFGQQLIEQARTACDSRSQP